MKNRHPKSSKQKPQQLSINSKCTEETFMTTMTVSRTLVISKMHAYILWTKAMFLPADATIKQYNGFKTLLTKQKPYIQRAIHNTRRNKTSVKGTSLFIICSLKNTWNHLDISWFSMIKVCKSRQYFIIIYFVSLVYLLLNFLSWLCILATEAFWVSWCLTGTSL